MRLAFELPFLAVLFNLDCFLVGGYPGALDSENFIELDRKGGGNTTQQGDYSFVALLLRTDVDQSKHICGGAVLSRIWVITAAHCINIYGGPSTYTVSVGFNRLANSRHQKMQIREVTRIVVHGHYNSRTQENDIALLKLARPLNFASSGGRVGFIRLSKDTKDPKRKAKMISWGYTLHNGKKTRSSNAMIVPIIEKQNCTSFYSENGPITITETMICAGHKDDNTCEDDTGGPLFKRNKEGELRLIGVASFGRKCGKDKFPGVYSKVSSFRKWIEYQMATK